MSTDEQAPEESISPAYVTRLENRLEAEIRKREQLEDRLAQLEREIAEDRAQRETLQERVVTVESALDRLSGLADGEGSTPAARARDLALALKNRAQARSSETAHMDYNDVKDTLTDQGHGTVYDQQAYRAMETAAENVPGVTEGTFNDKRVVRFNLDAFDGEVVVDE